MRVVRAGVLHAIILCFRRLLCAALLVCFAGLVAWLFISDIGYGTYVWPVLNKLGLIAPRAKPRAHPAFEPCVLPNIDPMDASIRPFLDPTYDPMANCTPKFLPITRMNNGRVEIIEEVANGVSDCEFRCNYPKNDYEATLGSWLKISHTPDCDVLEVRCMDSSGSVVYEYAHVHVYVANRSRSGTPKGPGKRPPDVHVLVLDSVSMAGIIRSMPRSMRFLQEEMGAVRFPYLNKVELNTRPNAYAMFFGWQPFPISEAGPFNEGFSADVDYDRACKTPLDDQPFIGFEFQRRGYKTMMSDDWVQGWQNWAYCTGFTRTPTDHYMRPFQLLYDKCFELFSVRTRWLKYWHLLIDDPCRGIHLYNLDYLKAFIDAYADEPKFSLTWLNYLSHDTPSGLYHLDAVFLDILKGYKKKLDNAFLIITADHGFRYTAMRETRQGELEDFNPALVVVVPEHLRENDELMANLKANAGQLTTHYDLYATLVNIAREGDQMSANSPFADLDKSTWNVTLHGESYLYPYNLTLPRNCANQRVQFDYCMCQNKEENCTESKRPLARRIASFVATEINAFLRKHNALDRCAERSADATSTVELLQLTSQAGLYRVALRTLPGGGHYSTYVKVSNEDNVGGRESFALAAQQIVRLDRYEEQAKCMKVYDVRPFCYCRDLLRRE
ncbi:Protein R03G8.3 [Aphelenchoides avenae]|nr:Protein R03G8.3 [Aphelenchus avenae]